MLSPVMLAIHRDALLHSVTAKFSVQEVNQERHTVFVSKRSKGCSANEEAHKEACVHKLGCPGVATEKVPLRDNAVRPADNAQSG